MIRGYLDEFTRVWKYGHHRHRAVVLAAIHEGTFPLPHHFGIGVHDGSVPRHSAHQTQLIVVVSLGTSELSTLQFGPLQQHLAGCRLHRGEEVEMAVRECWECRNTILVGTELLSSFKGGRSE
jgi:hypothetical protein